MNKQTVSSTHARMILLVEDDEALRTLLERRLKQQGIGVLGCGRISDAVRMLANQKFAAILLDMRLEQGSGERVIAAARSDKSGFNYSTPILVISGSLHDGLIKTIGQSVQGVLVKPFTFKSLLAKLNVYFPIEKPDPDDATDLIGKAEDASKPLARGSDEASFIDHISGTLSAAVLHLESAVEGLSQSTESLERERSEIEKAIGLLNGACVLIKARRAYLKGGDPSGATPNG